MKLAQNVAERVNIRGGGKDASFWQYVQTRFSKEALRTKHPVGRERDRFIAELVKRRDALEELEKAFERCKENTRQTRRGNREERAALAKERKNLTARIQRARKRYLDYQNKSIELNFRFILKNAARYSVSVPMDKFDDLIQECVIGWQRCLQTYNPKKGQLTTHASFWIYQAVQRDVFNDTLIRIPCYMFEDIGRLDRLGIKVPEDASDYMKEGIYNARKLSRKKSYVSLDNALQWDDEDGATFAALLEDDNPVYPEDLINTEELSAVVESALDILPSNRERDILRRRFGLSGGDPDGQTLDTIAADYGLTRERVRQIESAALERIRVSINTGKLQIRASRTVKLRVIQGGGE